MATKKAAAAKAAPKAKDKPAAGKTSAPKAPVKAKAAPKASANMISITSLKQLAEGHIEGIQKATYFKVDPALVQFEEGFNLRTEGPDLEEHLERMYVAMKGGAYVPPIDVKVVAGRIIARDGHCRTRVAMRLKSEGVDYLLEARQVRGNDQDDILHMLGSAQGKAFTPLEQGRGFLRLINMGMNNTQIADKTGLHLTTIANGLTLAEAPAAVQKLIATGKVSVQVVLKAIKEHGDKAKDVIEALVKRAAASGGGKVTPGKASGPNVPKATARTLFDGIGLIRSHMDDSFLAEIMAMNEEDLATKTVPVPAGVLKAMLASHEAAENKAKNATKADDAAPAATTPGGVANASAADQFEKAIKYVGPFPSISVKSFAGGFGVSEKAAKELIEAMIAEGVLAKSKTAGKFTVADKYRTAADGDDEL